MKNYFNNQSGFSIVIILALLVILTILGASAISMANNRTKMVTWHQQREQALQYAEAGIHRYMAELSLNPNFYGTETSNDMQQNNIEYTTDDGANGYFKIMCTKPSIENPNINITSTGWNKNSPDIKRTVTAKLQKKDLLQNAITTSTGQNALWYTRRYIRGDRIYGPLHVNGNLIVNGTLGTDFLDGDAGPLFYGKVTYSGEYEPESLSLAGDTTWFNPEHNLTDPLTGKGKPEKVPLTGMLSMNVNLKSEADSEYVFQGRTCICLKGTSMTIRNKNGSAETKPLPENGIVYVKGNTGNNKWSLDTANVFVSGTLNGQLTIAAENDIYITGTDPTIWEAVPNALTNNDPPGGVTYADLEGKTFIPENVETLMTETKCNDMLGLIANRNVRILRYNWPKVDEYYWKNGSTNYKVAPYNMNIHATICAVTGSFEFEDHRVNDGDVKGEVLVFGSIIQNRTGALAGYAINLYDFTVLPDLFHDRLSGYARTFVHDPRLMYQSPPSFAGPENSGWEMVEWQEVSNPAVAEPEP